MNINGCLLLECIVCCFRTSPTRPGRVVLQPGGKTQQQNTELAIRACNVYTCTICQYNLKLKYLENMSSPHCFLAIYTFQVFGLIKTFIHYQRQILLFLLPISVILSIRKKIRINVFSLFSYCKIEANSASIIK